MSVLLLAALLGGCAAPAPVKSAGVAGGPQAAAGADLASVVYFTIDGKFAEDPPASESTTPLTTPVNSPFTGSYPSWRGVAPHALRAANATLHLYVTSTSASVRANALPVFAGIPGIGVNVTLGNVSALGNAAGPQVVRAGDVVELTVPLKLTRPLALDAAAPLEYRATVYYTHVAGAAEFDYVLGPTHAMRIELSS